MSTPTHVLVVADSNGAISFTQRDNFRDTQNTILHQQGFDVFPGFGEIDCAALAAGSEADLKARIATWSWTEVKIRHHRLKVYTTEDGCTVCWPTVLRVGKVTPDEPYH